MEYIPLIIVAIIILLDLLHERECKKIYKDNRRRERELIEESVKRYKEYERMEEEKRHKRENLESEIKNHQINLISNKDIR